MPSPDDAATPAPRAASAAADARAAASGGRRTTDTTVPPDAPAPAWPPPAADAPPPTGATAAGGTPGPAGEDVPAEMLGPFRLHRQIGVGGMGVVYLATYTETGRKVAVKVLTPLMHANPAVLRRFQREMDILKKLRHKHIVRYFGGGKSGGRTFYAMELMRGGSVDRLVRKDGPLDWRRAVDIADQIAQALEYAHKRSVTHRDLKPGNLFFDSKGNVKLGDFGIARDSAATALTAAGKTVGTYAYMAPEQITGKPEVGPRTDLYALGCVLCHMLTGRPPFVSENPAELLFAHINEEPPNVPGLAPDCPMWLGRLINRLLEKDPRDRPFDALAVQTELLSVSERTEAAHGVVASTAGAATRVGNGAGDAATRRDATVEERREVAELLGRTAKKKKRREAVPPWEKTSVLLAGLAAVAGLATWALWPAGEEELYADARVLMASDDINDWRTAREQYIDPLLARFPESAHAEEANGWVDRIEVDILRRQIDTARVSRLTGFRNEVEKQYADAEELVKFGDLWTAADRLRNLDRLLADSDWVNSQDLSPDRARHYEQLVAGRRGEVEDLIADDPLGKTAFVENALRDAETAFRRGDTAAAREKWRGVLDLYADDPSLKPHVDWARARIDRRDDAERPAFLDP